MWQFGLDEGERFDNKASGLDVQWLGEDVRVATKRFFDNGANDWSAGDDLVDECRNNQRSVASIVVASEAEKRSQQKALFFKLLRNGACNGRLASTCSALHPHKGRFGVKVLDPSGNVLQNNNAGTRIACSLVVHLFRVMHSVCHDTIAKRPKH